MIMNPKFNDIRRKKNSEPINLGGLHDGFKKINALNIASHRKNKHFFNLIAPRHEKKQIKNSTLPKTHSGKITDLLFYLFPSRLYDLLQMTAIGLILIFFLNLVAIYHSGLNLKSALIGTVYGGYSSILIAREQLENQDIKAAQTQFQTAMNYFEEAEGKIRLVKQDLTDNYSPDLAERLIAGIFDSGTEIARAGLTLTGALADGKKILGRIFTDDRSNSLTLELKSVFLHFEEGMMMVARARDNLANLPSSLIPEKYLVQIEDTIKKIDRSTDLFGVYKAYFPHLLTLLGDRHPQRYLLLFQNKNERRPTGGFIGSFAIVDFNDGYMTKFDIHDIYDFDGRYHDYIEPPEEIKKLSDTWRMRDSNYSPDFALSAAKVEWFLQKEGGPSVDHVFALDQSILISLMELSGEIKLSGFAQPLKPADTDFLLSYVIESKIYGETSPKVILKDIKEVLMNRMKDPDFAASALPVLLDGIRNKSIQAWSKNPDIQKAFSDFGLDGRIRVSAPNEDYLNIIDISVGGNKSDRYIEKTVEQTTFIDADGEIINKVTLGKTHTLTSEMVDGWADTLRYYGFEMPDDHIRQILGDNKNFNMERVYVPAGSILMGIEGLKEDQVVTKYDREIDKTFYYFPMMVLPGKSEFVSVIYKLPYKLEPSTTDYTFYFQNQAGTETKVIKRILPSTSLNTYATYPENELIYSDGKMEFSKIVSGDFHLSALLGKK